MPIFGSVTDPTTPIRPSRIGQDWRRHRGVIGLPTMRFHDLRHRHATSLLEQGVPIHQVSRRLGHGSPTITLAVYAHALAEHDTMSADAIAKARRAS
jgi:integrase